MLISFYNFENSYKENWGTLMNNVLIETDYFTLYTLTEGVYAAIAKPGQGAWSNVGIVDLGSELLVFDSFSTPSAAKALRNCVEELTSKKVKYLINSHFHGDHVFGNQIFEDVTIISTSVTNTWFKEQNIINDVNSEKEEMTEYLSKLKHQIETSAEHVVRNSLSNQFNEMAKVFEELSILKMVLPSVLFEKKLIIQGSKRKVELHCLGGGHSPSDTFMYLPEDKIAFMGDIITEELHLPIYQPEEFLNILKDVKQFEIETVVPGHGNIGTLELCDVLVNYLLFLIKKVKKAHQNKVSLNDLISEFVIPMEYINWKGVKGINRNLSSIYKFYASKPSSF